MGATATPRRLVRASTVLGLLAALLWATAVPYAVHVYLGGEPRFLLRLGSMYPHPPVLDGVPRDGRVGYDGQFFATLATDPLLRRPGAAAMFDNPSYRVGRIGLPLVSWALGLGDEARAILVYQLLCWALAALATWTVARWLEEEGHAPWWAAPIAFSGGVVVSIFSSLPDAAAATLLVAGLWLHERGRRGGWPLLAAAALVKETSLVASMAAAIGDLRGGRRLRAAATVAVPVALLAAWRAYAWAQPGFQRGNAGLHAFGVPFAWLPERLRYPLEVSDFALIVGVLAAVAGAAALLPAVRRWTPATLAFMGFAAIAAVASRDVYFPAWVNPARVLAPLPLLAAVLAEREEAAWRRWLLRLVPISFGVAGAALVYRWAAGFAVVVAAAALIRWRLERARRRAA